MKVIERRTMLRALVGLGGLGGLLVALACSVRGSGNPPSTSNGGMMGGSGMMGSATSADMSTYMNLFNRHTEIRRTVEEIPGGVRTITESDDPALRAQLQAHVSAMYQHVNQEQEVTCMSSSLPTLFRNSTGYRRQLSMTPLGVSVTETSSDPRLTEAIRDHAKEVSGFVRDGMPAMMRGLMSTPSPTR